MTACVPAPVDGGAVDAVSRACGITAGAWGIPVPDFNPRETILISETTSESECCLAVSGRPAAGPADAWWQVTSCSVTCSEVWPA